MMPRLVTTMLAVSLLLSPSAEAAKKLPSSVQSALQVASNDRGAAISQLRNAVQSASNRDKGVVRLHLGEQQRLAGQPDASRQSFTLAMQEAVDDGTADTARFGMMLLDSTRGLDSRVLHSMITTPEKSVLATQNAERFTLLAIRALVSQSGDARSHRSKALSYAATDSALLIDVEARIKRAELHGVNDQATRTPRAPMASTRHAQPETPEVVQLDSLAAAREALAAGETVQALAHARQAMSDTTDPDRRRAAEYVIKLADGSRVDPSRIGVLLPLSGKYGAAGKQVKEALLYGWNKIGPTQRLIFVDSGSSPETAVEELESLVIDQGVIAVVGPLLTQETLPVVEAAEGLGVPLLSLSQSLSTAGEHQWIYQMMVTPRQQVSALLDHTMSTRGMESFGIFAPDSSYGKRAAEAFRAEVEARGGTIRVEAYYTDGATDLMEDAKRLGRKDYSARAGEYGRLKQRAREAGRDPGNVVLPPLLDFDGLFVPERASRVPIVCAALAYEEFPIGSFQTSRNGPTIPLMGLSSWNNADLVAAGGSYTRSALFTDAFVPPPGQGSWLGEERWRTFVDEYRDTPGRTPTPMEAIAADAGLVLATVALDTPKTREGFRAALAATRPGGTVTRVTGFDGETHELAREIQVISVGRSGFVAAAGIE